MHTRVLGKRVRQRHVPCHQELQQRRLRAPSTTAHAIVQQHKPWEWNCAGALCLPARHRIQHSGRRHVAALNTQLLPAHVPRCQRRRGRSAAIHMPPRHPQHRQCRQHGRITRDVLQPNLRPHTSWRRLVRGPALQLLGRLHVQRRRLQRHDPDQYCVLHSSQRHMCQQLARLAHAGTV